MENSERLIEAVREFECLWKVGSKSYKDLRAKENAWKRVAEMTGESDVADCQRRWKSLRDRHVRETKKLREATSGTEGQPAASCWPLFRVMTFINDTIQHRQPYYSTVTNFVDSTHTLSRQASHLDDSSEVTAGGNEQDESSSEFFLQSLEHTFGEEPHRGHEKSKKRKRMQDFDLESAILSKLTKENGPDAEEHFGLHVASVLRGLPPMQRAHAKIEIDKLLFRIQFPDSNLY